MPAEKISAYLSHSYRHEDRQVNEFFWRLFWANGVTFAVDPEAERGVRRHCHEAIRPGDVSVLALHGV
jgi:hypothetical protein